MKVTTLKIHNIGLIADTEIKLDKPLILFYGEIRQGKTTILNAVRWVCGGAFPSDIIRHGEKDAFVELGFDGGVIRREWYVSQKDKSTKAREVQFVRNGKPVASPVGEIKRFLNPFLLDQDFFRNKSELERKQYFTELFAVDTSTLDTELFNAEREAVGLRAKIKGYGEIDLKEVKPVDVSALQAERQKALDAHAGKVAAWRKERDGLLAKYDAELESANTQHGQAAQRSNDIRAKQSERGVQLMAIVRLQKELEDAKALLSDCDGWLAKNPPIVPVVKPERPDVSRLDSVIGSTAETREVDAKISEAAATNVRAEQYAANKKRADSKADDEKKLAALELRGREIKKEKTAKLKTVSDSCGIEGLEFDESGDFTYEGTQAGMLSTSQIMKLSSALSDLYPEGFGLDLLDRGESLGKSIFGFIERAQKEDKTILATIVGEKPAQVPEHVGVFVVENGKVMP